MDGFDLQLRGSVERWSDAGAYRALVGRPTIRSVLVLKVDHVGDFILGFDALLALREGFPDARFELVCAPWNVELARSLELFDAVHGLAFFNKRADGGRASLDEAALAALELETFDLAIDLRIDADTRVLLRHVQATYTAGFEAGENNDVLSMFLPHYLPVSASTNVAMHQSLLMLRLARSVVDMFHLDDGVRTLLLERAARPSDIDLSVARGRHLVVCNTSSGRAVKNWPLERFRNTVRWLALELDAAVLLVGGPDQAQETEEIIRYCGSDRVISAVGRTSIGQAIGLIARASLYLGNDSGLTHVAGRLGIPTVGLFSGIDPTVMWAALGPHVTILRAPVSCSPCHIMSIEQCVGAHACVLNISEHAVRGAIRGHLLGAARHGDPALASAEPSSRDDAAYRGWTGGQSVQVPQRFSDNLPRYIAQGGELPIGAMLAGFSANNSKNRGDLNRFYGLTLIFDQIIKEGLYGDLAELGVYKGNTATMLAEVARRIGSTAYLLDTYEGFDANDLEGVDANKRMEFADTSLTQVQALVGTASTCFVKGYFPSTANQIPIEARFCLVHIDCDLYAPFIAALEFFYERLVPGGFLVMHDYSSLHWDGAARAVDEFFADKPESVMPMPDGSGTVVVRRACRPDRLANWLTRSRVTGFANAWVVCGNSLTVGDMLHSGWSEVEDWGVWGLGTSHTIDLHFAHRPEQDFEFTAETIVTLRGDRRTMTVAVLADGETLTTWHFAEGANAGVRVVRIPHRLIHVDHHVPALRLEFRPSSCEPPHDLDPADPDMRPLGMGLLRFRQREL